MWEREGEREGKGEKDRERCDKWGENSNNNNRTGGISIYNNKIRNQWEKQ